MDRPTLQSRAEGLAANAFLGGRAEIFEAIGRLQLITLLRVGLYPDSRVLDLGCGCLRGGYWLIHFLRPERYFGIEPNLEMLQLGKSEIVGADLLAEKRPRFLTNDRFDASEFGVRFDFFIARSIWTHASRRQITEMLDTFVAWGAEDSVFLTSFLPAAVGEGDTSPEWVGRSHLSKEPGTVRHDLSWVEQECCKREIAVREWVDPGEKQVWLLLSKGQGARPSHTYLARLADGQGGDRATARRRRGIRAVLRKLISRAMKGSRSD